MQSDVNKERLAGKVAIVTGAARGLGASFAKALTQHGARVAICDVLDTAPTVEAIRAAGRLAIGGNVDVTDSRSVNDFVQRTVAEFGRLDVLINNAALSGSLKPAPIREITSAEWDRVLAVNTRGVFEFIKAASAPMLEQGYGKIINLASGTAIKGAPGMLHYVASKGAIIAMTRAAARELGDGGIRVNCIAPGLTMSDSMKNNPNWPAEVMRANIATRALKREADPEDLLGAAIFLSSAESDFITGQTLAVDGGSVMN
ncbi:SDR family NAD(P)-dependent oxidoreductase [Bradyrhizobium liaoningense]